MSQQKSGLGALAELIKRWWPEFGVEGCELGVMYSNTEAQGHMNYNLIY